jgi:putative FmdB family regulatory protein
MPIYEYHCGSCSHELDALQKISDSPLRKCPECGKLTLRRLMSAPAFRLKGAGWYETDFMGDGEKKRNLVETSSGESGEGSKSADSTKSEAPAKADGAAKEVNKPADKPADKAADKPADKPAASEVRKPRKTRAAKSKRT